MERPCDDITQQNHDVLGFPCGDCSDCTSPRVRIDPLPAEAWPPNALSSPDVENLRKLCVDGVPHELRGQAWLRIVKERPHEPCACCVPSADEFCRLKENNGVPVTNSVADQDISKDLRRTFPTNPQFLANDGPEQLERILAAYSRRCPEVGYCQGMNFVAATVLLTCHDPATAFAVFCFLVESVIPGYFNPNLSGVLIDVRLVRNQVKHVLPSLSQALETLGFDLMVLLPKWFCSALVCVLPSETLLRVWDGCLVRGRALLIAVVMALLKRSEEKAILVAKLEVLPEEALMQLDALYKWVTSSATDAGELLREAHLYILSPEEFEQQRVQADNEYQQEKEALQLKDMDRLLASETNFSISEVEKLRTLYQRQLDDEAALADGASLAAMSPDAREETLAAMSPEAKAAAIAALAAESSEACAATLAAMPAEERAAALAAMSPEEHAPKGLDVKGLEQILEQCTLHHVGLASLLHSVFDKNQDGFVDMQELIVGLSSLCKGSVRQRLELGFRCYDVDNSEYLDLQEIQEMVMVLLKLHYDNPPDRQSVNAMAMKVFRQLDVDHDNKVDMDEFVNGVVTMPAVMECFCRKSRVPVAKRVPLQQAFSGGVSDQMARMFTSAKQFLSPKLQGLLSPKGPAQDTAAASAEDCGSYPPAGQCPVGCGCAKCMCASCGDTAQDGDSNQTTCKSSEPMQAASNGASTNKHTNVKQLTRSSSAPVSTNTSTEGFFTKIKQRLVSPKHSEQSGHEHTVSSPKSLVSPRVSKMFGWFTGAGKEEQCDKRCDIAESSNCTNEQASVKKQPDNLRSSNSGQPPAQQQVAADDETNKATEKWDVAKREVANGSIKKLKWEHQLKSGLITKERFLGLLKTLDESPNKNESHK